MSKRTAAEKKQAILIESTQKPKTRVTGKKDDEVTELPPPETKCQLTDAAKLSSIHEQSHQIRQDIGTLNKDLQSMKKEIKELAEPINRLLELALRAGEDDSLDVK